MNQNQSSADVIVTKETGRVALLIPASMDTAVTGRCEKALLEYLTMPEGEIVFDMCQARFVSSSFLRICMMYLRKVGPARFKVVNMSPDVKKVFKLAGLEA